MAYDKRLSKSERNQIKSIRRIVKDTGFRESEKHLNAVKGQHYGKATIKVEETVNA